MWFTDREKAAINRLAKAMIFADGELSAEELIVSSMFDAKFNIEPEMGDNLDPDEALNVVAALTADEKRCVCSYMGTLMAIDGVDSREHLYWNLLSARCSFPTMTVAQAGDIFQSYM